VSTCGSGGPGQLVKLKSAPWFVSPETGDRLPAIVSISATGMASFGVRSSKRRWCSLVCVVVGCVGGGLSPALRARLLDSRLIPFVPFIACCYRPFCEQLLLTFLLQLKDGVSEAATGIPGIGVDFGGVGGGLWGLDGGLFQVWCAIDPWPDFGTPSPPPPPTRPSCLVVASC
jgi:hypothetical protein